MSGAAQKNQGAKPKVHKDNLQPSTKTTNSSSSADNATASTADGDGSENRAETSGGGFERSAGSPEPNCAICLGALENKSFTDSCFHMFCFVCLQEWSKVKPECPLCKQPFKSIIHNVKSYDNYDQFYLDHHPPVPSAMRIGWNFDRSFRYRTTLTMDHRYILPPTLPHYRPLSPDTAMHRSLRYPSQLPRYYRPRHLRSESVSTTNFRREIYRSGRRVTGLRSSQYRRTVTPEFFRSNPAQTHRLVPWLNRELNALLYSTETEVTFVLELIMDLIKRFPIDSDEFYEHIHSFLYENTRHFMHEFLSFARSPYTMRTYDTKAVYEEASHVPMSNSDSSSSNLDVVVVDDDDADEAARPGQVGAVAAAAGPSERWRSPHFPANFLGDRGLSNLYGSPTLSRSGWDSPTPGPSWDMGGASSQSPVSIDDSSDSEASTIIDPTYIAQDTPNSRPQRSRSPDESDGEDVIFVSYDKPWEERSPIQLSSGSDDEALSKFAKRLKREHKKKKVRATATSPSSSHHSRSRHRERSLTPPVAYSSKSPHDRSAHNHDQPTSSSNKSRQRHQRKRHHDALEEQPHSSSSRSRREKRGHLTSATHTESSHKKQRRQDRLDEDSAYMSGDSRRKKHKHKKKHKKNKDKSSKSSKRREGDGEGHASGISRKSSDRTSSRSREEGDRCKKHPSGHKKSRARDSGEGGHSQREAQDGSSGHHSDALLSDTSTSSSSSTSTITSTTDREPLSAGYSTRQQRVQQVLQERCQANNSLSMPVFPGMDASASWESITRLARLLASQAASSFPPSGRPGPSHFSSSNEPVIISTSSDESDQETLCRRPGNGGITGDCMSVAKTVVVPCSSRMGVPTPAIDYNTAPSTSASRPLIIDECIDVESISSDDESVVDVESLDDTEDSCAEPTSSSSACEMGTSVSRSVGVTEVSAEVVPSPVTLASLKTHTSAIPAHPFSIQSILNRDVFMGAEPSSQPLSRQASTSSNLDAMVSSQDFTLAHSQSQSTEGLRNTGADHSRPLQAGYVSKLDQLLPQRLLSQPSQDNGYQLEGLSLRSLFPQQSMESKESVVDGAEHNKESQVTSHLLSPQSSRVSQADDGLTDSDEELDVTFLETTPNPHEGTRPASVEMREACKDSRGPDEEDGLNHHSPVPDEKPVQSASASSSINTTGVTQTDHSQVAKSADSAMGSSLMEQNGTDEALWGEASISVPQNSGNSTVAAGVSTKKSSLSLSPSSSPADCPSASGQEMDTSTADAGGLNTASGDASVGRGALSESESSSQDISDADTSFEKESLAGKTTADEAGDASTSVKNLVASTCTKDLVGDREDEFLSAGDETMSLHAKMVVDDSKTTVDYACSFAGDMFAEGEESLLADVGSETVKEDTGLCVQSSQAKLDTAGAQDFGGDKGTMKDTLNPSSDILDSAHPHTDLDLDSSVQKTTCLGPRADSVSQDGQSDSGSSSADLDLGQSSGDLESEGDLDIDRCLSPLSSSQNDSTILSS